MTDVVALLVRPITDNTIDLFGKHANDLQSNVAVGTDAITGHLNYVADYTGFSSKTEEQSGNYLAIHAEVKGAAPTAIKVKVTKAVTLEEDGDIVLRIADKDTQTVTVTATFADREDIVRVFTLTGLDVAAA